MDSISSSVVGKLVDAAHDRNTTNMSTVELEEYLLATMKIALKWMQPEISKVISLSNSSPAQLAKELTRRISQNQAFKDVLPKGGEISPRFAGVVGTIGKIAYDVMKAATYVVVGPTDDVDDGYVYDNGDDCCCCK